MTTEDQTKMLETQWKNLTDYQDTIQETVEEKNKMAFMAGVLVGATSKGKFDEAIKEMSKKYAAERK